MAKRDELLASIRRQLSVFEVEVRQNNDVNRQGINISAEDILGGLLNLLRDWKLQNANAMGQNFPAIDLADWDEGVVVQVSSDTSSTKIKETLEKLKDPKFEDKEINKLVMMFLKPKLRYSTVFEHEGFELEIIDFDDLSSAVEHKSVSKLKEISDYLDEELGKLLGTASKKPKHQLPGVPAPSASFIAGSRNKELADLKEMLSPDAPIFLWGVGGIGKTEVAIQLARNFAPPEGAYFLHYYDMPGEGEALRETILRANFTDYTYNKPDTDNRDQEYKERMDILRTEYRGSLLVIDNFDRTGKTLVELQAENAYRELTAMGIQLVFTTRSPVKKQGYEIVPLDEEFLLTLMRDNLDGVDVSDDDLHRLIEAVDRHTLMVVLMARTLAESWGDVTPEKMLEALRGSDLNRAEFPEVVSDQNQRYEQRQIYAHMRALFDLSRLNVSDRAVLRYAVLLPADGMDGRMFRSCLGNVSREKPRTLFEKLRGKKVETIPSEQEAFTHLVKTGWLAVDNHTNLLTIHPVIREICGETLKPTDETCQEFLKRLGRQVDKDGAYLSEKHVQVAKCFSQASDRLEDSMGAISFRTAMLWFQLGQDKMALSYCLRARKQHEENLLPAGIGISNVYALLGNIYSRLGEYEKALESHFTAMVECERNLPPDAPQLAIHYDNMGATCCELGDYQEALQYQLKALAIFEKNLPENHEDLAIAYNNVGSTYGKMADFSRALKYQLKSVAIREKMQCPDHVAIAIAYNNLGGLCGEIGDAQMALKCHLKALSIREKVLPADHPDLAQSFLNVGSAYCGTKEYIKTLEYLQKAIRIYEKILPADHPYLAHVYDSLGSVDYAQGDYQKAMEYAQKALAIREKVLLSYHPDVAKSYHNMGLAYGKLGDYDKALEWLEKALEIVGDRFAADHPHIVSIQKYIARFREEKARQEQAPV